MYFAPGEQALALRAAVQARLQAVTPTVIRAGWPTGDAQTVDTVWRDLATDGVLGALVAESAGGYGLDVVDVLPAIEAFGYAGLPRPVVETMLIAAPLLADARSPALTEVLAGQALVAVAPDDGELLPFGQICDVALLPVDGELRLFDRADLDLEAVPSVDGSRRLARLRGVSGGSLPSVAPHTLDQATHRGALGTAALLTGLSRRMLDITVAYVKEREQFGVPIGSFQAIKHQLASALVALRFALAPVYAAGWALTNGAEDVAARVSLAKAMTSEAALRITRIAIQCHGAIAYTTEYDLHLFAKRVWALAPAWGDGSWHRRRIAEHLGLSTAEG